MMVATQLRFSPWLTVPVPPSSPGSRLRRRIPGSGGPSVPPTGGSPLPPTGRLTFIACPVPTGRSASAVTPPRRRRVDEHLPRRRVSDTALGTRVAVVETEQRNHVRRFDEHCRVSAKLHED